MDAIKENFEKVVSQAQKENAQVELLISGGENLKLEFQKKKLEKFESTQSQMAGFRVILGASQGYAYTENFSLESFLRTYGEALNNAKTLGTSSKEKLEMVKPTAAKADPVADMGHLYCPEDIPMEKKLKVAETLESACFDVDARIQAVPYCSFNESLSFSRVLNSEGLDKEFKQNYYSGYSYPVAKDESGTKSDYDSFFTRKFADIDARKVAEESVKNAVAGLGAQQLKTGNYAVVIDKEIFSTMISMIEGYFSAKEVHEQKSLLNGKLNQKIASEKFELIDDPFDSEGTGTRPFDSEGAPSQKTVLIEKGILKNYLTNLEYARKMNLPHTAHAARGPSSTMNISATNLIMSKGSYSREELLKRHDKVVFLRKFNGALHAGFKESTGDFSMPAEGFLYEKGVKQGPVDQFVMSGNIFDLLRDIEDLGNEYSKAGSSIRTPDVLIKQLSFAGA